MNPNPPKRGGGALASLALAMRSRRTAAVVLQSFASGLPLGLVWYAIPDWMRDIGVDIRVVGLITLAQAPWTFKVLWAPLMDRYVPPFWGRRRGWMAVTQVGLFAFSLLLAGVGERPEAVWVVGALAMAVALSSASQDVAIDAYAVEVLHKDEQGAAAGARTAMYRAALLVSGGAAISLAARIGWPAVNALLALVYLPMLLITWKSPEPEVQAPPPQSLRDAVWQPFLSFLTRPRALEILAFVVLYKFADQLYQSLTRPFLIDMGYNADQRGIALATIGVAGTVVGSFIGGWVTTLAGLGTRAVDFRFPPALLERRVLPAVDPRRAECRGDVRGNRLRAAHVGHGNRRLFCSAAATDREAILGNAVRALLEPLRVAACHRGTDHRVHGRCGRLVDLLPVDDRGWNSRARDARTIRAAWCSRARFRRSGRAVCACARRQACSSPASLPPSCWRSAVLCLLQPSTRCRPCARRRPRPLMSAPLCGGSPIQPMLAAGSRSSASWRLRSSAGCSSPRRGSEKSQSRTTKFRKDSFTNATEHQCHAGRGISCPSQLRG